LAIVICGITLCARAGGLKSDPAPVSQQAAGKSKFRTGLLICIASGLLSSMLNLAFAFGSPVTDAAVKAGTTPSNAQNAIWALAIGSGSLSNIGYAVWLLFHNKRWHAYGAAGVSGNWSASILMGALWMVGILVYGVGASALGSTGPILGWPLFMSTVIVTSNVWGFLTGEWKSAPPAALRWNFAGVSVLIVAIIVIGSV
jgi:L-rhamnose-H+ transport protein